jgi:fructose/tagatose bisphosphate aldolase
MITKGKAMTIAANGRNNIVIRGVLAAAQRVKAAVIIEIAKSEGGASAYCAVNYWNIARQVDAVCNELGITVPVAIHADHYGIKSEKDLEAARIEIPTMFGAGITSIAIDASHQPDDKNLLANIELARYIPEWAGMETEIGEIKGSLGLSSPEEAEFLIKGLNAHSIFPDWIALNNGTTHGIEASASGIDVELTRSIHQRISPYHVSGAQHGTSGNSSERLRQIAEQTVTTKANVATALQMIAWGLEVNEFGNATIRSDGSFCKLKGQGVTEKLWEEMTGYAKEKGLKTGDFKKLNLPFENKISGQPQEIRNRMAKAVEDFTATLLSSVFNAGGTSELVVEDILRKGSYDPGFKCERIEPQEEWTMEKIVEKAALLDTDKGPDGDFDD